MAPPGSRAAGPEDERFIILQMVQDGSITPDEGARLLEAMDRAQRRVAPPAPPAPPKNRTVHLRIIDPTGDSEVDLNLPLGLVEMGLNIANKVAPGRIPDFTEIRRSIQAGFTGQLINISNGNARIIIDIE